MWKRLRNLWQGMWRPGVLLPAAPKLLDLDPGTGQRMLRCPDGLSHIDWHAVQSWLDVNATDSNAAQGFRRSILAYWLQVLSSELPGSYTRWRTTAIEGIAPGLGGHKAWPSQAGAAAAQVEQNLRPFLGDAAIDPVAVIALADTESYYSLISDWYPESGAFATSSGLYHRPGGKGLPSIVLPSAQPPCRPSCMSSHTIL